VVPVTELALTTTLEIVGMTALMVNVDAAANDVVWTAKTAAMIPKKLMIFFIYYSFVVFT
jgi:hypothetical protein